jgi:hypothetical protein
MGIDVRLEGEDGEAIQEVGDGQMILARAAVSALDGTRLLRYLMPYGDTVFNQAQAADLSDDLRQVIREHSGTPLAEVASRIEPLVERLGSETHLYLWFRGD